MGRCLSSHVSGETEYYLTSLEFALEYISRAELPAEVLSHHVENLLQQTRQEHKQANARCIALKEHGRMGTTPVDSRTSSFDQTSKYYVKPALAMNRGRQSQSFCLLQDEHLEAAGWVQTVKFCEIQTAFLFSQIEKMEASQAKLARFPGCLAAGKEVSPLAGRCDVPVDSAIRMRLARKSCVMAIPIVSAVALHPATKAPVQIEGEMRSDERGAVVVFQPTRPLPPRHMVRVLARWPWCPEGGKGQSVFSFRTSDDPDSMC